MITIKLEQRIQETIWDYRLQSISSCKHFMKEMKGIKTNQVCFLIFTKLSRIWHKTSSIRQPVRLKHDTCNSLKGYLANYYSISR